MEVPAVDHGAGEAVPEHDPDDVLPHPQVWFDVIDIIENDVIGIAPIGEQASLIDGFPIDRKVIDPNDGDEDPIIVLQGIDLKRPADIGRRNGVLDRVPQSRSGIVMIQHTDGLIVSHFKEKSPKFP